MEQTAVEKKFGKYVMASMITMFLQSAYSMIDGLFVSNLIGDTALSAVNVAWPVIAVVTAIGTGVGCGGAVMSFLHYWHQVLWLRFFFLFY